MMQNALLALSVLLAACWIPVFRVFFGGWRERRNPVSLAICGMVALMVYSNVLMALYTAGQTTLEIAAWVLCVFNAFTILNFFVAFRWAKLKFDNARAAAKVEPRVMSGTLPPTYD